MIDSIGADINPIRGIYLIPFMGLGYRQNFGMTPSEILADNLRALMAAAPGLDTVQKIVKQSDGRLSNGKVDRIRRNASVTDINTLNELAKVFGVKPWQLLIEGLNPHALPTLSSTQLLAQIKDLVEQSNIANSQTEKIDNSKGKHLVDLSNSAHRMGSKTASPKTLGPGLRDALAVGQGDENAGRKSGRVQKQGRNKRA